MMKNSCTCGRILYDDVSYCPSCGRPMATQATYLGDWTTEARERLMPRKSGWVPMGIHVDRPVVYVSPDGAVRRGTYVGPLAEGAQSGGDLHHVRIDGIVKATAFRESPRPGQPSWRWPTREEEGAS